MKKQSKALKTFITIGKTLGILAAAVAAYFLATLLSARILGESDTPKQSPKETLAAEKAVFIESEKVND